MHDGMPYGRNQGQGQGHSREVDRQSRTGLIFVIICFAGLSQNDALLFRVWMSHTGRVILVHEFGAVSVQTLVVSILLALLHCFSATSVVKLTITAEVMV